MNPKFPIFDNRQIHPAERGLRCPRIPITTSSKHPRRFATWTLTYGGVTSAAILSEYRPGRSETRAIRRRWPVAKNSPLTIPMFPGYSAPCGEYQSPRVRASNSPVYTGIYVHRKRDRVEGREERVRRAGWSADGVGGGGTRFSAARALRRCS